MAVLKNVLIVVNDIEMSKAFYRDLFGLRVITDFGGNVILTEGLVLQTKDQWEEAIGQCVCTGGNDAELYFEEYDLESFVERLESSGYDIKYITKYEKAADKASKKLVRLYDPDGHMIEVAEKRMGGSI